MTASRVLAASDPVKLSEAHLLYHQPSRLVMRLKAVTVDLWETIIEPGEGYLERVTEARARDTAAHLRELGYDVSAAEVREALSELYQALRRVWSRHRDISSRAKMRALAELLSLPATPAVMRALSYGVEEATLRHPPRLASEAREVLAELREMGLKLALISNTGLTPGRVMNRLLEAYGVLEHFKALVYSDEVKERKPSVSVFTLALRRLGAEPGEAAHVGDDPYSDVYGAKEAGMLAIHLSRGELSYVAEPDAVIRELRELPEAVRRWV